MGFDAQLHIVYPVRNYPFEGHTIWHKQEIIDLGSITRFAKLQMPGVGDSYDSFSRAGICMWASIQSRLVERLKKEPPSRSDFAPPFLVYRGGAEQYKLTQSLRVEDGLDHVEPGFSSEKESIFSEKGHFSQKHMESHNAEIRLDDALLTQYIDERYCIEISFLNMWASCAEITAWLHEEESGGTEIWKEVSKEPLSVALFRARRAYLQELSAVEAHVLFIFPFALED
jgi:hypothetical protein